MARKRGVGPGVSFFAFQDIITAVVGIFILIALILVLELAQRVEAASAGSAENLAPVVDSVDDLRRDVERLRAEVRRRSQQQAKAAPLNTFNRAEKVDQLRARIQASAQRRKHTQHRIDQIRREQSEAEAEHDRLLYEASGLEDERNLAERLSRRRGEVQEQSDWLAAEDSAVYRDQVDQGRFLVLVTLSGGEVELRDALARTVETLRGPRRLDRTMEWFDRVDLRRRHLFVLIEPGGAADFAALKKGLEDSGAVYGFSVAPSDHSVRMNFELEQAP